MHTTLTPKPFAETTKQAKRAYKNAHPLTMGAKSTFRILKTAAYICPMSFFRTLLGLVALHAWAASANAQEQPTERASVLCAQSKKQAAARTAVVANPFVALERKYDTRYHHLDLQCERNNLNIIGKVRTLALVTQGPLDTFALELHPNHTIDSVRINGILRPVFRSQNEVRIPMPSQSAGTYVDAEVWYHGTAPNSGSAAIGNGYSTATSPSWGNQVTWSLSQPYSAYEWWPCKQQLTDKIDSVRVWITTDSLNKAGSNGVLERVVNVGNGKRRHEWFSRNPIDYYLISIAVAKYVDFSFYAYPANSDSVLIQNYIYDNPQTLPNFQNDILDTRDMLELYSDLFGSYPFANEKYGHCMAPFSGGMEHQTMTSQGFFNFSLTAHELTHQWFGDYVTCKTWSDIFVNEGFASYGEQLAIEFLQGATQATSNMNGVHTSVMQQPGGSVWFADTTSDNRIFDSRLSYDKGAAVLHTLRYVINNDSLFFLSLRNYLQQYSFGNATALEFFASVEATTGLTLTNFVQEWIYGQGYPTYSLRWGHNGAGTLRLILSQTASAPSATPLFTNPLDLGITVGGTQTIMRLPNAALVDTLDVPMVQVPTAISIDPKNWVVNKVGTLVKDNALFTGINDVAVSRLKLVPNPVRDLPLRWVGGVSPEQWQVFSLDGRMVLQGNRNDLPNADALAPGAYHIRWMEANGASGHQTLVKP